MDLVSKLGGAVVRLGEALLAMRVLKIRIQTIDET